MKFLMAFVMLACFEPLCWSQENKVAWPVESGARPLHVSETLNANSFGAAMQLPIRCDDDGNVYLRFYHSKGAPQEPIHKFNRKGEHVAAYSITSDTEFTGKGKAGLDFAVDKDGAVYQLGIGDEGNNYIIRYGKDGTIKSKTKLQATFTPYHFQPFESGNFLIIGADRETDANLNTHALYTGIFDQNGILIKKVGFSDDKDYQLAADRGDAEFAEPGRAGGGNFVAERGSLALGSDGNVYVVRWATPTKIYVVSPAGEVVRTISIESPQGTKPGAVYASKNRLALQFEGTQQDPRSVVKIISSEGEVYATYDSTDLGVAFACFTAPDRFLFLGRQEQALQLNFAEPR